MQGISVLQGLLIEIDWESALVIQHHLGIFTLSLSQGTKQRRLVMSVQGVQIEVAIDEVGDLRVSS